MPQKSMRPGFLHYFEFDKGLACAQRMRKHLSHFLEFGTKIDKDHAVVPSNKIATKMHMLAVGIVRPLIIQHLGCDFGGVDEYHVRACKIYMYYIAYC
jgi:hypothetical protein